MSTRGFVTIATGSERYYKMAFELLRSYRRYTVEKIPFAIICDQENNYTKEFDQVILLEHANCSYMDKLLLYRYLPYDETIFIDADPLILSDPSGIWEDFADQDDVSCYGCTYALDSKQAWFTYDGCGKYKDSIEFLVDLHGGIYYLRNTERCRNIFEKAIELAEEYSLYGFRNFEKPADEPVLAMSLAIHQSKPCDKPMRVLFVPSYRGKLRVHSRGELFVSGKRKQIEILHFASPNTELFMYQYLIAMNRYGCSKKNYLHVWFCCFPKECKAMLRHAVGWILRRLIPLSLVNQLKERL